MNLGAVLDTLRRRWRAIAACALIAVTVAAVFTLRQTSMYESTVRLFVSTPSTTNAQTYQDSLFSQERAATYADIAGSRRVAQKVVEDLDLTMSPALLQSRISSEVVPDTVLLLVNVQDPDPEEAKRLANATGAALISVVDGLESKGGQSSVRVLSTGSATLPASPVTPNLYRNLAAALILGLLLGAGFALLREATDTRVRRVGDVATALDAPVIGSVEYDSSVRRHPLVSSADATPSRVEAFRLLRTNVECLGLDKGSNRLVVSSCLPDEGKTITAVNLAISLAEDGRSVVLVEADLRQPKVAGYLDLVPTVGLTTVLTGMADLDDALQPWGQHGLQILTCGVIPSNPTELLNTVAMQHLLRRLSHRFDLVLLVAPALLPFSDATVLSTQCDGVLAVVKHGSTTLDELATARERLARVDRRLLGSVFNMVPKKVGMTSYGVDRQVHGIPSTASESSDSQVPQRAGTPSV